MTRSSFALMKPLLIVTSTLVALAGCGSDSDETSSLGTSSTQGTWDKLGYGDLIHIEGRIANYYQYNSQTCVLVDSGSVEDLQLLNLVLSEDGDSLLLPGASQQFHSVYSRVESLPASCVTPIQHDKQAMFEHVWHTFNEYYGFFAERGVNWLMQYDEIAPTISNQMSDEAFFSALALMLQPVDDVHIKLIAEDAAYSPGIPKGFYQAFLQEFNEQSAVNDIDAYFAQELTKTQLIIEQVYLEEEYQSSGGINDDLIRWGTIGGEVGYVSIGAFIFDFESSLENQLSRYDEIMGRVLTDLSQTRALIVDIRLCPGGADPMALATADYFADDSRLAFTKSTRTVQGESAPREFYLNPKPDFGAYTKPVVVITSGYSASASEVFTLAMRALPNVVHIGEVTIGALSDALEKELPDEWSFHLSNEVYRDVNGEAYENVGITPHIEVGAFEKSARDAGQDSALDVALDYLETRL